VVSSLTLFKVLTHHRREVLQENSLPIYMVF